jgi:creatinine amidohydrolase
MIEVTMHRRLAMLCALVLIAAPVAGQTPAPTRSVAAPRAAPTLSVGAPPVEFEMMTWPEVKSALAAGKTTALVYNGGTEQRGPQNVNGGHTLMARATVKAIARKLGNAIAAPVLPFSPNNASADLPGTIGLTPELYAALNEQIVEQLIKTGFRNVVLMGDHGGGQKELGEVARKLDEKYTPQRIRVVFCDEVYAKANGDFDEWLEANGYPKSSHAGIPDTSEMLFLGASYGWVRKDLIKTAIGDPVSEPSERAERTVNNGITGDARRSSSELGKRLFEMKVDYAVRQIKQLLAARATTAPQP